MLEHRAKLDKHLPSLMELAGKAIFSQALALIQPGHGPVLLIAGPGNNGGDALEAAAQLSAAGYTTDLIRLGEDAARSAEAQLALNKVLHAPVQHLPADTPLISSIRQPAYQLIIDGLFGIGLNKPITGTAAQLVVRINNYTSVSGCPLLAIDVPSGLHAETGAVVGGEAGCCIAATHTLSLIGNKPGLHTADGKQLAGQVLLDDLQLAAVDHSEYVACLTDPSQIGCHALSRKANTHKGSFGDVAIIGGTRGMAGAGVLAARAALFGGAGRIFLVQPDVELKLDMLHPEIMCRDAAQFEFNQQVVVIGPGLGQDQLAIDLLRAAIQHPYPVVIDADALNLLATKPGLAAQLKTRTAATLLTPHPLEAARLLAFSTEQVQQNRAMAAKELAQRFGSHIILKGAGSLLCDPQDRHYRINSSGNPGLASGGTGDVLAGLCGALLAQGMEVGEAAALACWAHGAAADALVAAGSGPIGLHASELLPVIRSLLNRRVAGGI
ncbi:NAD(P)H-hydrate dehydratase [Undibacterium sp. CY7W]|uniref:Bifunctional NAD(P)H-hydrate repair enzyme n=1 Tax=Undibacterium rugosum TaxID=2762291 RepID=A0A923I219_9BURK|nr:NAD(P)H-hydrate dehydratase [Undibacterium rugosum]MBC3934930.1 NAD(P)H-hydrate dehydratase [Undibacterium rugosum]